MFVRGQGTELWDVDGKRYLDFLCGLAVISLGHANPVDRRGDRRAGAHAAARHQPVRPTDVADRGRPGRSTRCSPRRPGCDGQVFFCNSGAEANEAAIKLARKYGGRGRHVVVSAYGSFHGRTLATLAATGQPAKHEPFFPMPDGFRHVAYDDVDALEAAVDPSVAAVLLETGAGRGWRERRRRRVPPRRPRACATSAACC